MPLPDETPEGVDLYDFEDFQTHRKLIFDDAKDALQKSFPLSHNGIRTELKSLEYVDPEEYDPAQQKEALLKDKYLARRLRGKVRLFDDNTNEMLDEKDLTLMRVPYLTERGTFIHGGNEYASIMQGRLRPGVYTRRKKNGELETQFNVRRGTGSAFRVGFLPETKQYKLHIHQANLHLYSLLRDMGTSDEELAKRWGPAILEANAAKYDSRVLDKAYDRLVSKFKQDPAATREDKISAVRTAMDSSKVERRVAERNLPNMFSRQKAASWRELASLKEALHTKDAQCKQAEVTVKVAALNSEELQVLAQFLNNENQAGLDLYAPAEQLEQQILDFVTGSQGSNPSMLAAGIEGLKSVQKAASAKEAVVTQPIRGFDQAVRGVLDREGGTVTDSGGFTNKGISTKAHPSEDIANMTDERATEIYRSYWPDYLPDDYPALREKVFDVGVNGSPAAAQKMLQQAMLEQGLDIGEAGADGIFGSASIKALPAMDRDAAMESIKRLQQERYDRLRTQNPEKYGVNKGWDTRSKFDPREFYNTQEVPAAPVSVADPLEAMVRPNAATTAAPVTTQAPKLAPVVPAPAEAPIGSTFTKASSAPEGLRIMQKLARFGAGVLFAQPDGKFLLEENYAEEGMDPKLVGKLRPAGGGKDKRDSNLKQTILREMREEFGLDPLEMSDKIALLGYQSRGKFKDCPLFIAYDHGLSAGTYQATNSKTEKVILVESTLDDPDYIGPQVKDLRKFQKKYRGRSKKEAPYIAVDLDGTLAENSGDGKKFNPAIIGQPIKKMVDRVNAWIDEGKEVKVFTARAVSEPQRKLVEAWLATHKLPPMEVTNRKTPGMVKLFDDRAVGVEENTGELKSASLQVTHPGEECASHRIITQHELLGYAQSPEEGRRRSAEADIAAFGHE